MNILILNGPNLNMLGLREPEIYGSETLDDIETSCIETAEKLGFTIDFRQSNAEGELVDWIQDAAINKDFKAIIINAGAYTHTSIAIHDALKILTIPIIEVHITDPKSREKFRHTSFIEPVAKDVISGQGPAGYSMALERCAEILKS